MANIIQPAKPGSEWTRNELCTYNIAVASESLATFFGNPILQPSTISPPILAHQEYPAAGLPDDDRLFFDLMEEAMAPHPGEESVVDDFAVHLLHLLGYHHPNHFICTRKDIPLFMCSSDTHAKTDVCVTDQTSGILLLLQEDKRYMEESKDTEPQLIAGAVAAFQFRNCRRAAVGQPPVNANVIPGITMVGTAPTFYKVDITTALINAVEVGEYPAQVTTVRKLILPVQFPYNLERDGM